MDRCPKIEECKEGVDATKFEFVCIGFWEACDNCKELIPRKTARKWYETWEEDIMTNEEKEWIVYEEGWEEGHNDGITNFVAVEKEKNKLREKGLKVI